MPERRVLVQEVLAAAVSWLDAAKVPYALVGGLTLGAWAEPRVTADVDVIVAATPDGVVEALPLASTYGFKFNPIKTAAQARRQGMCRLMFGDRHFDVVCGTSSVELRAIERARPMRLLDQDVKVASAEDIILFKLLAGRTQDVADVEKIADAQKGRLDVAYLRKTAGQMARDLFRPDLLRQVDELVVKRNRNP